MKWESLGCPIKSCLLSLRDGWVIGFCLKGLFLFIKGLAGLSLIGAPPVSEGVQIRLGCQFIGSLFRSLCKLPGGLNRFIPGSLGTHLCRLSHLGWLQCSHGLTSRPLESSLPDCLSPLLDLLEYPANAISALSNGTLRIRYCTRTFAGRVPPWGLGYGKCPLHFPPRFSPRCWFGTSFSSRGSE